MDLVYIPEVLTYGFFRAPQYRDYEQPWNRDYFSYDKSTQAHSQRLPQHHEQKLLSKENCYLCRENKRRRLAAYIRGKSRKSSCHEIHEEEEELDANVNEENNTNNNSCVLSEHVVKDNELSKVDDKK
ncbi:uncharacterized protein LOC105663595 [Megachile rotundata]|uniref:uncharacterized protein LOC105663595 n=1 Tax=Megachile rotundata TaxID=143995 RepID=UPI003FD1AD79